MDLSDLNLLSHLFNISRETIEILQQYQALAIRWNEKLNLISSNSVKNFWERHIIDSLQLLKFISDKDIHLVDIGTGAGFPGLILSIAGVKKVTLVESDSRKAAFLLQASILSSNKVDIVNDRAENLSLFCNIITCRAFANIDNILELTSKIKVSDKYLLLKGEAYSTELNNAKKRWKFDCNVQNSITLEKSKIIEIKNIVKIA